MRIGSGYARETFVVPAGAGSYAPEEIITRQGDSLVLDKISKLAVYVESLPASAEIEVDLLKPGTDPRLAASWILDSQSLVAVGLVYWGASAEHSWLYLAGWPGVRIRAKSGGTAGDSIVSVSWERCRGKEDQARISVRPPRRCEPDVLY